MRLKDVIDSYKKSLYVQEKKRKKKKERKE